jgi:hypothetical protein
MDLALCELEVEALLKAARSRGLQPLQTKRAQNETPPRRRFDFQNDTPPRRRYESRASSSSSSSRSPPGRRSPNSVLSPHGSRAPELKRASELRKGSEVSGASRLSKLLGLSKDATPEQVRVSELRGASETRAPDFREASAESCQGSAAYKGLESSTAPQSTKTSGIYKKPSFLSKSSELKSSTASWTSEPRRASAAPTYMLPTATSLRKQSPLKPSADGLGADCAQRPKWQLPSPKVRRTTLRHAPSKPEPPPEERTSRLKMTQSPVKGQGVALYPSALPKPIRFGDRSACDPRQVVEERKGRLREELNRRGGVGAAWQQSASLRGGGTPFDERQQAPWVLAL